MATKESFQMDMVLDRLFVHHRMIGDDVDASKWHEHVDRKLAEIVDTMIMLFSPNVNVKEVKDRLDRVYEYRQRLHALLALPKLEQRTPMWYEKRSGMITASDYAQAINKGKFGTQRDFFAKKCGYEVDNFDNTMAPLVWGIKYEPVANDAYSKKNAGLRVHEFGLLEHPDMSFLGASPDGITDTGVMLEIKCPFRRKINGIVPEQYYYQIQGQLDVCDLEECDYLECEFLEYATQSEFKSHFDDNCNFKGIIIETTGVSEQQYKYVDARLWTCLDEQLEWLKRETLALGHDAIVRVYYWQLYKYSVLRMYRDKAFIAKLYDDLTPVWNSVQDFRKNKGAYDVFMNKAKPQQRQARAFVPKEMITIDTSADGRGGGGAGGVKLDQYSLMPDSDDE
jgi:putative phage-type endonuclease